MSGHIIKTIGGKDWNFRLKKGGMVAMERNLKQNTMDIITNMRTGKLPMVTHVCEILFHSLKSSHPTLSREKMYKLYDQMLAEGWDLLKTTDLIIDIFKDGGLIPEDEEGEDTETDAYDEYGEVKNA